jgi:DNA-binding CsgD family transcriptional regulator
MTLTHAIDITDDLDASVRCDPDFQSVMSTRPDVAFHTRQLAVSMLNDPSKTSRARHLIELNSPDFTRPSLSLAEMLLASVLVDVLLELGDHPQAALLTVRLEDWSNERNDGALVTARSRAALAAFEARSMPTRSALSTMLELISRLEVQTIDNAGDLLERARAAMLVGRSWALVQRCDVAAMWLESAAQLFQRCGQLDWARTLHLEAYALDAKSSFSSSAGARPGIGATTTDVEPIPRHLVHGRVGAHGVERPQANEPDQWSVGLTPAERRVALLIGGGRSNRETAAELFVSIKTVESHVQAVYRKLGLHRRSELAHLIGRSAVASLSTQAL